MQSTKKPGSAYNSALQEMPGEESSSDICISNHLQLS